MREGRRGAKAFFWVLVSALAWAMPALGQPAVNAQASPPGPKDVAKLLASAEVADIQEGIGEIVIGERREFREQLGKMSLDHKQKEVRRMALLALLRLEDTDLPPEDKAAFDARRSKVWDGLRSTKAAEQMEAIQTVAQYHLAEFAVYVAPYARSGRYANVGEAAVRCLRRIGDSCTGPLKFAMLQTEAGGSADYLAVCRAARAGELDIKRNEKEILARMQNGTEQEKESAIGDVGEGRLFKGLPFVEKAYCGPPGNARYEAYLVVTGWEGPPAEEEAVCAFLRDLMRNGKNDYDKLLAASALLQRSMDREAMETLLAGLRNADRGVRRTAAMQLQLRIDARIGAFLIEPNKARDDAVLAAYDKWWDQNKEEYK